MYLLKKKNIRFEPGFAIVATLSILSLLVLLALSFISLSSSVSRLEPSVHHKEVARANARLALADALHALQLTMGKDQMVCAEAAIRESPDNPLTRAVDETGYIHNRRWVGSWKTTYHHNGRDWPVVGKLPDIAVDNFAPYKYKGIYNDLRNQRGAWREELFERWLVSGEPSLLKALNSPDNQLSDDAISGIKMVGKNTLGHLDEKNEVVVPLVGIYSSLRKLTGRYAFWVTNNNLKANLVRDEEGASAVGAEREVSVKNDPGAVLDETGGEAFDAFFEEAKDNFDNIIKFESFGLASSVPPDVFKQKFHDFTSFAYGLQTNVQYGGFKRDLTPLMLGEKGEGTIEFKPVDMSGTAITDYAEYAFRSDFGIIPGERHGVLNPVFDGIRDWGQFAYTPGMELECVEADRTFSAAATKMRDGKKWARGVSDGYAVEASQWAIGAPKVKPVMNEANWHMGFSFAGAPPNSNFRFHLAPRVVLWNPYSVSVKMPKMVVLMPNPFKKYTHTGVATADDMRVKFLVEDQHAEALKANPSLATIAEVTGWTRAVENQNGIGSGGSASFYSFSVNSEVSGAKSWAPRNKYLAFEVEATQFKAGQCLVFSPKVTRDVEVVGPDAKLKFYDESKVSNNVLSASEQFGYDHFISTPEFPGTRIRIGSLSASSELSVAESQQFFQHIDFSKIFRYRLTGSSHFNPHAVLKYSNSGDHDVSGDEMVVSPDYLTLQTINCGQGGTEGGEIQVNNIFAENVNTVLEDSDVNPRIRFPRRFQMGVKRAWLDESGYEGNEHESYRHHATTGFNDGVDSVFFKQAMVAYGNVRPDIVTRAPHQFTYASLYAYGAGTWLASYASPSPSEVSELPMVNPDGLFSKNPFGAASQMVGEGSSVMFDLPDPHYGALSMGSLRHAALSPFSWHPSYIIGNSLAPLSAPSASSAHPVLENCYKSSVYMESTVANSFDYWVGGIRRPNAGLSDDSRYWKGYTGHSNSNVKWGAATGTSSNFFGVTNNESLLSNGTKFITKSIGPTLISSEDEILDYDISFEVNQNLFDNYFISGMKLDVTSQNFNWSDSEPLNYSGYTYNNHSNYPRNEAALQLGKPIDGLAFGFWNNGYLISSEAQFNVNSVSVDAWVAVLSGSRNREREMHENNRLGGGVMDDFHIVSRVKKPMRGDVSGEQQPYSQQAYGGARVLTDQEVRLLAECIVYEVKTRGPFLSLADFVNRRLGDTGDKSEVMGALESAIQSSGLNQNIEDPILSTTTNLGTPNGRYQYNVAPEWMPDYGKQVGSLTWGIPSYINQGDILTPLAPQISVRGDTYTVRAYGQSVSNGEIMAEEYLEAVVIRLPEYMNPQRIDAVSVRGSDRSTKPNIGVDAATGKLSSKELEPINKKLGRRFKIISMRWMSKDEI